MDPIIYNMEEYMFFSYIVLTVKCIELMIKFNILAETVMFHSSVQRETYEHIVLIIVICTSKFNLHISDSIIL